MTRLMITLSMMPCYTLVLGWLRSLIMIGTMLDTEDSEGIRIASSGADAHSIDFKDFKYCYSPKESYDDTSFRLIKEVKKK